MSSPPVRSIKFLACVTASDLSQWTETKIPPLARRPSYLFASYSGMPAPIRAPVIPPTTPSHAESGERSHERARSNEWTDARYGQRSDVASHHRAPPIKTPELAPAVTPSGALLDLSVVNSLGPRFPGAGQRRQS